MLFNLVFASIITLLCFLFFFRVSFNSFFIIPVVKENVKVKRALITPAGIPITFVNEVIPTILHLLQIKQLMFYQYNQEQQCIYSIF